MQSPHGYPLPPEYLAGPGVPRRNRRTWVVVLSIVGAVVLLFVLFVAGLVTFFALSVKSSEPYQHAQGVAIHDARVEAALGTPVVTKWYVSGSFNMSGSSGNADFEIPVSGSRNNGTLYVAGKKSAGHWSYQRLELAVEGQETRIDLLSQSNPSVEK
jgi:Cytochrome oxidase complex assembly protein 1